MFNSRHDAPWYRSLTVQTLVFLSIALLPIGLISVFQTRAVTKETNALAEAALQSATERAVLPERDAVQRAFGTARALAGNADRFFEDPRFCQAQLAANLGGSERVIDAALVSDAGEQLCSSTGAPPDAAASEAFLRFTDFRAPSLIPDVSAPDGAALIYRVVHPLGNGTNPPRGYLTVSIIAQAPVFDNIALGPRFLATTVVDKSGQPYSTAALKEALEAELPQQGFGELQSGRRIIRSMNGAGDERIYSMAPIVSGDLYSVAIWDPAGGINGASQRWTASPTLFPIVMWLASLAVAMLAMNRLVMRHIRDLGRRMRRFAIDRKLHPQRPARNMSAELNEINAEFEDMAHGILQDEAELVDTVRSKNVLIKEVHHRVKNNLQLISSIMNIQMRRTDHPETREILGNLQDRVLSLATIHENLYQMRERGRVDAARILHEIIDNSHMTAANLLGPAGYRVNIQSVFLFPDQAAPLSLLVTELLRNAQEYNAPDDSGSGWVEVSLNCEDKTCVLSVRNSCHPEKSPPRAHGIGGNLIRAFVSQLDGKLNVDATDDYYSVTVTFDAADFIAQDTDF